MNAPINQSKHKFRQV